MKTPVFQKIEELREIRKKYNQNVKPLKEAISLLQIEDLDTRTAVERELVEMAKKNGQAPVALMRLLNTEKKVSLHRHQTCPMYESCLDIMVFMEGLPPKSATDSLLYFYSKMRGKNGKRYKRRHPVNSWSCRECKRFRATMVVK